MNSYYERLFGSRWCNNPKYLFSARSMFAPQEIRPWKFNIIRRWGEKMFGLHEERVVFHKELDYAEDGRGKPDVYVIDAYAGYNVMFRGVAGLSHIKWYQDKADALRTAIELVDKLNAQNKPKPKKPTAEEVGVQLAGLLTTTSGFGACAD